jgi:hypothetical protein
MIRTYHVVGANLCPEIESMEFHGCPLHTGSYLVSQMLGFTPVGNQNAGVGREFGQCTSQGCSLLKKNRLSQHFLLDKKEKGRLALVVSEPGVSDGPHLVRSTACAQLGLWRMQGRCNRDQLHRPSIDRRIELVLWRIWPSRWAPQAEVAAEGGRHLVSTVNEQFWCCTADLEGDGARKL